MALLSPTVFNDFILHIFPTASATPNTNLFFTDLPESGAGSVTVTPIIPGAVPEPSTWAMMVLGFAGLGFLGYRQTAKARVAA